MATKRPIRPLVCGPLTETKRDRLGRALQRDHIRPGRAGRTLDP